MTVELDGLELASAMRRDAATRARRLRADGVAPSLAILLATDDGGARWYSESIARVAAKAEIACELVTLPADASEAAVADAAATLAQDHGIHGILVQTPLPPAVDQGRMAALVPPGKDIDGMNPTSLGHLMTGLSGFVSATAAAVVALLAHHNIALEGCEVVIAGRSVVVGKPLAHLCLNGNATVTICHSRTRDLDNVTRRADVLVAAVGRPEMFNADYIRTGATVIDVGTNETADGGLTGDVDAASMRGKAGGLTPVPGGVGPVTTARLLLNVVEAAERA